MMDKVETPKVFISYAWGTKDYQSKVLSFASSLMMDGVDVILDKWQLEGGNDMNAFMEKCVKDPSVTNVLILLDKNYAEKADARAGGVGTETQIISQQVYASVDQNKFIPVVFERGVDGSVYKPIYLNGRFHYDLSEPETYNDQYRMLIKALYGVETYKKPKLGDKPAWVDEDSIVTVKRMIEYDSLKQNIPSRIKEEQLRHFLEDLNKRIIDYTDLKTIPATDEEYVETYSSNRVIRGDYLTLLEKSTYCDNRAEVIGDFFENVTNRLDALSGIRNEIGRVFIHELFIYTIAVIIKQHAYKDVGYLLGRTYFPLYQYNYNETGLSFVMLNSAEKQSRLDDAVCKMDGKRYYSGTAAYWIATIDINHCSKEEFACADSLCYNYALYGKYYIDDWKWFPITYVYLNELDNSIYKMAKELISLEKANKYIQIFNYDCVDDFKQKAQDVEEGLKKGAYRGYSYPSAFETAPVLGYKIEAKKIGSVR